jgi:hypothetical protein
MLFAVNGGLFVVTKFAEGGEKYTFGRLSIEHLAVGGILFTALMTYDIWGWGFEMRRDDMLGCKAFTVKGQMITIFIAGLVMSGWYLATLPPA